MITDWLNVPASIMSWASGIIIVLIGVYFSRKKTSAEAADKITQSYDRLFSKYEDRLERVESDLEREQQRSGLERRKSDTLRSRIASLEHNDIANQAWIKSLETSTEALQKKMRDWSHGIEILIAQIERHDSRPDWTPVEDE